jgi:hypothetical protein
MIHHISYMDMIWRGKNKQRTNIQQILFDMNCYMNYFSRYLYVYIKMKKYILFIIILSALTLIWWCNKPIISNISFDDFDLVLNSKKLTYKEINTNISWDIYKTYIADNSWFTNSIVISKQEYNSIVPLDKIRQINIQKNKNRLQWSESSYSQILSLTCRKQIISWYLEWFYFDSINNEQTIYTNQLYIKNNSFLYIISTTSENSSQHKELKKMLKTITCKQ